MPRARAISGERVCGDRIAAGVAGLAVAGDPDQFRRHIGSETFERLPLRSVPGAPGLYAVAVRAGDGEEIVIRRAPVGQEMF